ncbi:Metallo-hydrolase/oxidoreductase [Aureobasidium sp. EXF-10727]|nr:Metallo-hydrolase/oxidoreductase [Aureobasidium sp. EXF-10727]
MSPIDIPNSEHIVDVFAIDTGTVLDVPTSTFIRPVYQGSERLHCPAFVFLVRQPTSGKQVLFDLGLRHDWHNLPPAKVSAINKNGWRITAGKPLAEVLTDHDINVSKQGGIDAVIWSHPHLDHIGDISPFSPSTELVVGKDFKSSHTPGYPQNQTSGVWNSDYENRLVHQIDFDDEQNLQIGGFDAHDYFGDGSFYLLDTPGHLKSHMCALARVCVEPARFVFLGGDVAHHAGQVRPSVQRPLPSGMLRPALCVVGHEGEVQLVGDAATQPFYTPSPGVHHDLDVLHESLDKVRKFDADDRIMIALAHDESLCGRLEFFPNKIDESFGQGTHNEIRWGFLKNLGHGE